MNRALVKQLAEKRQNIWEQAKALLDAAEKENRDLTAEEQTQYNQMSQDLTDLRSRIDVLETTERSNQEAEETLRRLGITGGSDIEDSLDVQLRALGTGARGTAIEQSAADMKAIWSKRALSKGTATAGGNTVPTSFYDTLVQHLVESSGLMRLGPTVLNTSSGETIQIPKTTSHGSAALATEASNLAGTDPAFGQASLGAYKYAQYVLLSTELVTDSAVDIEGYIAQAAGRNVGLALGAHLITGTGSSQPSGVVTGATLGKTGSTGVVGAPSTDDLIDLFFSVIAPYRNSPSCGWLLKDSSLAAVRKLKDGSGQYVFTPAATFGAPDTLLGKPVQTDPNVAAIATSAKSIVFGDFSRYFVRMAGGVRFERSTDVAFGSDQVAYRCIIRADGALVDQTGAVKYFVGAAS